MIRKPHSVIATKHLLKSPNRLRYADNFKLVLACFCVSMVSLVDTSSFVVPDLALDRNSDVEEGALSTADDSAVTFSVVSI